MERNIIHLGDCLEVLKTLPDNSVDCCITSPPYFNLRDYGCKEQIGLEDTPEQYIQSLVAVFEEVHRVLAPEGTLWVNIGDSYAGSGKGGACYPDNAKQYKQGTNRGTIDVPATAKRYTGYKPKDLIGIPWMLAFSLRNAGWYLRQDIIWHKPNPMPESVTDRCTKSHEYIFLLSKSQKYYFNHEAIQEPAVSQDDLKRRIKNGVEERNSKKKRSKFGGNKYGNNDDKHFATYSGKVWQPKTKNCQYDGQEPNSMHLRREEGLPDEEYYVRNKRDVWQVNVKPCKEAHFATYPPDLITPCILAGCPVGGVVLDPFMGSGTTALVAKGLGRDYIGIELNPEYKAIAERRLFDKFGLFL